MTAGHLAQREEEATDSDTPRRASQTGVIAADQLRSIVERIERLEEEKAGIADDIKDLYAESKGSGFCTKTLRKVVALRRLDAAQRDEADYLLATYCSALGMKSQLELFDDEN